MALKNEKIGAFEYDNLIYDAKFPVDVKSIALAGGQGVLNKGAVIARTADGDFVIWSGADGQIADCILADSADAGDSGQCIAFAYRSGHFIRQSLITAPDTELSAAAEAELRNGGIYLSGAVF